jgi:hypothetical protein
MISPSSGSSPSSIRPGTNAPTLPLLLAAPAERAAKAAPVADDAVFLINCEWRRSRSVLHLIRFKIFHVRSN